MKKILKLIFVSQLLPLNLNAATNLKVELGTRTKPKGTNIVAEAAYDHLLWGEQSKTNPMYGYARVGVKVGGSPTAAAFFQVAPIAPLILEASKSTTKRFLKSSEFNCDTFECKKNIERTDFTARLVFGYKDFFGTTAINFREIDSQTNTKRMALETEYFTIPSGEALSYVSKSIVLGYKFKEDLALGMSYEKGEISSQLKRFESSVGFGRFKWHELNWLVGIGHYSSNESGIAGNGAIISVSKKFGESLSLF